VKSLTEFGPDLIDAYPSSIEPLARFVLERGIRSIRPRAIITSSETLSPEVRAIVSEAFEAPVFDHYGAAEMAAFITQCQHGSYHPNPEFGIVEILQDDRPVLPGETGEIVATGFINPVMPLIRYRTGDLAVVSDRACACGRAFGVIDRIVGRLDDVVVTPEGRRIGRLDPIFKCVSSLREARVLQDGEDHVTIEVVVAHGLPDAERRELVHQASLRLGPSMRVDVAIVDAIPRTRAGKLRMVENRVSPRRHATVS
jgi:phenylacetate-CoA ligase